MKLVLCLEYEIAQHGGTEVLVAELIRGLTAHHRIVLVSPDAALPGQSGIAEHVRWQPGRASVRGARKLAQQIAGTKPDLVHFHLGGNYAWNNRACWKSPILHARRLGLPCLSTNHGAFSLFEGYCWERRHFLIKLALLPPAWLSKLVVLSCLETEVAVSRDNYRALRCWYWPLRSKFEWIYHSRLREHSPPPFNPHRRKVILCAGTIGPRKGQTLLVEAFCQLASEFRDWQLVLIGREEDAAMSRRIRELMTAHHLEEQIHLLGACGDEELREWFRQSAIFAMPSLYEGLGLSLQEAQFYGCACVGTRCGGVTDLIQEGDNGLLVPAGQMAPVVEALRRLMTDASLRRTLGARAAQSVLEKGMTAEKMVEAYGRLYAGILKRRA